MSTTTKSGITAATRVIGILGHPVQHSRSPAMHNAAFAALGLDYVYVALPARPAEIGAAVRGVRALGLAGANVTIPFKEAVLSRCDQLGAAARACRAVNTLAVRGDALFGDNTDVAGLARDWDEAGLPRRVGRIVILGAGGAARAAAYAAAGRARRVVVAARRPERARVLVRSLQSEVRAELLAVDLAHLAPGARAEGLLGAAAVVVNATAAGMRGDPFPELAAALTAPDCLFHDLVYTRATTPFMALATAARRRSRNGLGMLLHQGAAAFEIWTGRPAPVEVMRRALVRAGRGS